MGQWMMLVVLSLVVSSGCKSAKRPDDENLRSAIDQYLLTQTRTCIAVDGKFPLDVPAGTKSGAGTSLAALQQAGLVQSQNTTAVVESMANALSLGPKNAEPVKRYTVTSEGQKYFQQVQSSSSVLDGFCYGHEKVDSIVNWTEPQTQGDYSETTVTYTYKISNLAVWAKLPEVDQAFPSIGIALDGAGKNQSIPLHLTEKGWVVSGS